MKKRKRQTLGSDPGEAAGTGKRQCDLISKIPVQGGMMCDVHFVFPAVSCRSGNALLLDSPCLTASLTLAAMMAMAEGQILHFN